MSSRRPRFFLYKFFTLLMWPFALVILVLRILLGKEKNSRVLERFGVSHHEPKQNVRYIWLHAASIGEMKVAITIINALDIDSNKYSYLLTTQTTSSAIVFEASKVKNCVHHFLPLDLAPVALNFLNKWNPSLILFVESEIWPLYLSATRARKILLNARMSDSSYKKWRIFSYFASKVLSKFKLICASTEEDYQRYKTFNSRTELYGNVKLCANPLTHSVALRAQLMKNLKGHKVITFASTSAEEINGLVKVISGLEAENYRFIIVPRHPSDADEFVKQLKRLGITHQLRTDTKTPDARVYIANTFNELGLIYSVSDVVFIGGTMCGKGGQNMLEPVKLGVPTVVGNSTHNFISIMHALRGMNAIVEVNSYSALQSALRDLIEKEALRKGIVANIKSFNNQNRGILDRYTKLIKDQLKS